MSKPLQLHDVDAFAVSITMCNVRQKGDLEPAAQLEAHVCSQVPLCATVLPFVQCCGFISFGILITWALRPMWASNRPILNSSHLNLTAL